MDNDTCEVLLSWNTLKLKYFRLRFGNNIRQIIIISFSCLFSSVRSEAGRDVSELELLTFKRRINKISQQTFASVPCIQILFRIKKIQFVSPSCSPSEYYVI